MDLNKINQLRQYLKLAHHLPGRIRIKFNPAISGSREANKFLNDFKSLPWINDFRINYLACSVIIEYDKGKINPYSIQEFFTTDDSNRLQAIIDELSIV